MLGDVLADADFVATAGADSIFARDIMRYFHARKMLGNAAPAVTFFSLLFGRLLDRQGISKLSRD